MALRSITLWSFAALCNGAVTVTETQRVHPVLIRNDHSELLELVVNVSGDDPISLRSVACTLGGTGIETVELLSAADKMEPTETR